MSRELFGLAQPQFSVSCDQSMHADVLNNIDLTSDGNGDSLGCMGGREEHSPALLPGFSLHNIMASDFLSIQHGVIDCVYMHVHVRSLYACGGQRSMSGIFFNCFPPFLRQGLS